jgi:hypothetical protein
MTSEQARDLQAEMEKLALHIRQRSFCGDDGMVIAKTLAEVLAHLAVVMESRSRVPRKR